MTTPFLHPNGVNNILGTLDRPVLFFDWDGVLNDHKASPNGFCGTTEGCVREFNRVIDATNCILVVSSSWRYMVLMGEMTVKGFGYMMQTHGIDAAKRLAGVVRPDAADGRSDRGRQISEWIRHNRNDFSKPYAVVDDMAFDIREYGHPFVQTDGAAGLSPTEADELIGMLLPRTHNVPPQQVPGTVRPGVNQ